MAFARESPVQPYTYQVVEVLKGHPEKEQKIDLLVNSVMRRRLAHDPASRVLLVRQEPRSAWQSLGFANTAYQAFTRTVLSNANRWQPARISRDRLNYFETLLSSDHDILRRQAVLEISRGPYRRIKAAGVHVPRQDIYAVLSDITWLEWSPFYIVLLGQSPLPEDKKFISDQFKTRARVAQVLNLAAWSTAFMESGKVEAVAFIADNFFRDPSYDRRALIEMQKAMSVLGSEYPKQFRQTIVAGYQRLLRVHPTMAGLVARDAANWRDWSFVHQLKEMIDEEVAFEDPGAAYAVSYYLSLAGETLTH
ncbi:MAG: hypothetical protein ACR2PG_02970 [Hyphomicrobiaceae bacterium]